MCNNDNRECENRNCIGDILKVILVLQENACPDSCLDTCDRPMLGGGVNCLICNTRPVTVYTCCGNGVPWSMPICKDSTARCPSELVPEPGEINPCSAVFRVEKLEGNCCTFRVLADNPDPNSLNPYIATNSFFTMDLNCCCAIRCLNDTFVDCIG